MTEGYKIRQFPGPDGDPWPSSDVAICPCCNVPTAPDAHGDCSCAKCGWEFTTVVRSGDELKSNPYIHDTSSWEAYEAGWRDAINAAPDDSKEAVDIIDLLKTVIETELVQLGLPLAATPTSGLGRARAFISKHGPALTSHDRKVEP